MSRSSAAKHVLLLRLADLVTCGRLLTQRVDRAQAVRERGVAALERRQLRVLHAHARQQHQRRHVAHRALARDLALGDPTPHAALAAERQLLFDADLYERKVRVAEAEAPVFIVVPEHQHGIGQRAFLRRSLVHRGNACLRRPQLRARRERSRQRRLERQRLLPGRLRARPVRDGERDGNRRSNDADRRTPPAQRAHCVSLPGRYGASARA
jgi:hypothetical protein